MQHQLVVEYPSGVEKQYPLHRGVTSIGRAPENDISLAEEHSISRRHAKIEWESDGFFVTDLGSKNGTKVNGRLITRKRLVHRDQLVLGRLIVTYQEPMSDTQQRARIIDDHKPLEDIGTIIRPLEQFVDSEELSELSGTFVMPIARALRRSASSERSGSAGTELERSNLKLQIMYRVASKLNTAPTLEQFLGDVLEMAFQVVGAERGFLRLLEDGEIGSGMEVVRFKGGTVDENITLSRTIADSAIEQKVAILVHDAQLDSRFCKEESVQLYGIRSALCVPIWNRTRVYGILYVDCLLSSKIFNEDDMELLTALANQVAMGIEWARLDEAYKREFKRRSHLERYFSPEVVDVIINKQSDREIAECEVTVLFADLSRFTPLSEKLPAEEIVDLLNSFFELSTDVIFRHQGTLDKFIGDCVMGLFGVPLALEDAPKRAISAALEILDGLESLNQKLGPEKRLEVRIGINTGRAIVGDIGPVNRLEYTVLGDSVNTASRLQSEVAGPGQIVVGEVTYQKTRDFFEFIELGVVSVKGKQKLCRVFEVVSSRDSTQEAEALLLDPPRVTSPVLGSAL